MPDIRIKDISTTASASASGDFFAIDGTSGNTRKLSAFSPTFGGNVTVNGTATFGNKIIATASTTSAASLNIPHGTAPTSPVNGDVWTTTVGLFARINGVSVGPYSTGGTSGGGSGTVTDVSITSINGISGTVSNSTTTPAISLSLGAITPSTVNGITLSGSSTPTLAITGTSTISGIHSGTSGGVNTGDQTITLTGDITGSGTGSFAATIASSAVTNAKLANVLTATFKGRTTAGTGSPEDLSATQATALLDLFSSSLKGLVPSSGGGSTNFLRADGTWAAPSGTGGGAGTVTTVSVTSANGISGTVANATSTPAITLALGAITPTSVTSSTISGPSATNLIISGGSAGGAITLSQGTSGGIALNPAGSGTTTVYNATGRGAAFTIDCTASTSGDAFRVMRNSPPSGWEIGTKFGSNGEILTNAWVTISGTGNAFTAPTTEPSMLGVWSDINGPTAVLRVTTGDYANERLLDGMDVNGKLRFSLRKDGSLAWGSSTNTTLAGHDATLSRSAVGTLRVDATTTSASSTSGALIVAGGFGVAGAGYFGGTLGINQDIISSSSNIFFATNSSSTANKAAAVINLGSNSSRIGVYNQSDSNYCVLLDVTTTSKASLSTLNLPLYISGNTTGLFLTSGGLTSYSGSSLVTVDTGVGNAIVADSVAVSALRVNPSFAPTANSGEIRVLNLTPTFNQTGTSTSNYVLLHGDVTQTAVLGSNNRLVDLKVGGTSKFSITSAGVATFVGKVNTTASSTSGAGLNLPHGSPPTSPVNGDLWTTSAGVYARINGASVGFGISSVNTISDLKNTNVSNFSNGDYLYVRGYYANGDMGQGLFMYNSSSSVSDNSGTIIAPSAGSGRWYRQFSGPVSAGWFGLINDNSTEAAPYINLAIASLGSGGGEVQVPTGTYRVSGTTGNRITVKNNIKLVFAPGTILNSGTPSGISYMLTVDTSADSTIKNAAIIGNGLTINGYVSSSYVQYPILVNGQTSGNIISELTIQDVNVTAAATDGLTVGGNAGATVNNVRFIRVKSSGAKRNGGSLIHGTNIEFVDCEFSSASGAAPQCGFDVEPDAGLSVNGVKFVRCLFFSNASHGLAINTTLATNIEAVDCRAYSNTENGFNALFGGNVIYSGCIANNNTLEGFYIACNNAQVTNCIAYSNSRDGFKPGGAKMATYTNCISHSNSVMGFDILWNNSYPGSQVFNGCSSYLNGGKGVSFNGAAQATFNGGSVYKNSGDGVQFTNAQHCSAIGTYVAENAISADLTAGDNIVLENSSCYNSVLSNTVKMAMQFFGGTATAGSTTTVTLPAGRSTVTGFYVGNTLRITGGTGSGQSGTISAYDGSTGVATVSTTWGTAANSTSVILISGANRPRYGIRVNASNCVSNHVINATNFITQSGGSGDFSDAGTSTVTS